MRRLSDISRVFAPQEQINPSALQEQFEHSLFNSSLRLSLSMYSTLQQYYTGRIHLRGQFAFNLLHSSSVGSILFHHQTYFFKVLIQYDLV